MLRILVPCLVLFTLTHAALAHTRSQSLSSWVVQDNRLRGIFQVDAYRVTQLTEEPQNLPGLLRVHLSKTVTLTQDGIRCIASPPRSLSALRGDLRMELEFTCPHSLKLHPAKLAIGAFFPVSLTHIHYLRLENADGSVSEFVLTQGHTNTLVGGTRTSAPNSFVKFLYLGFEHVLSGADHLAFLLSLVLLAGQFQRVIIAVTGFTLGHSSTLALAALGVLRPDMVAVEALIGFTVAWAAGDALARHRELPPLLGLVGAGAIILLPGMAWFVHLPGPSIAVAAGIALFAASMSYLRHVQAGFIAPCIATVFGLAHGAGFAGPFLQLRIPAGDLVWSLLAFNLGVEAGQLAALSAFGLAWAGARYAGVRLSPMAFDAASAGLFGLGLFWFVSRSFG